jgi:hypothetical protein
MDIKNLISRIDSLEQANRRLRLTLFCSAAVGLAVLSVAARGRSTTFETVVVDEIHVRKKLIVGDNPDDQTIGRTGAVVSVEDLPNDTGRGVFLSLTHKTGGAMTLSNVGKRPEISSFHDDDGRLKFYSPKWELRR